MVSKMRRQSLISLIFISLILVPGVVQAATWEYITYGGYDAAVKAWKLVALILSDRNYNGLIISAAVLGAICIFVATYIKIATGAKTGGLSWAVPVLAGLTLYAALVVPKDSLVIYDEKLNRGPYQIDGIPRGIATLAGILNKIEIGMIEIFSTSVDPASDYRLNSGGTGWEVIDYADPVMLSANLRQTLYNYIKDCVFVELARPGTILDADKIASGEQKYDTVITESRNPSLYTVKYDSSNPNGVSATCTEVGNYLIGVMNNPATWEEAFKNACAARGFDVTVPASYNQCKTLIESTLAKTFKDNNSITIPLFGAQRILGGELQNVIFSSAPSVSISRLATTNTMSQFIGLAVHANSWLPVIKESLMAIAVSAIPLLTLFIVTPLVGRALSIITGLFVWLTLWGVIDAIIHGLGVTLAEDAAAAMSFGGRVDVGLAQVLTYPGYAAKVAATFGGLRWSGLMIASVITAMIIRFGGTALAMLAGSIASLPQGSGQQYGVSAIRNPEGVFKSEILPTTTIGSKLWAAGGADNYAKGLKNLDIGTDAGRVMSGSSFTVGQIAYATANTFAHGIGAGIGFGSIQTAFQTGVVGTERTVSSQQAFTEVAQKYGMSAGDLQKLITRMETSKQAGFIHEYANTRRISYSQAANEIAGVLSQVETGNTLGSGAALQEVGVGGIATSKYISTLDSVASAMQTQQLAGILGTNPYKLLTSKHSTEGITVTAPMAKSLNAELQKMGIQNADIRAGDRVNLAWNPETGEVTLAQARAGGESYRFDVGRLDKGTAKNFFDTTRIEVGKSEHYFNTKLTEAWTRGDFLSGTQRGIRNVTVNEPNVFEGIYQTSDGTLMHGRFHYGRDAQGNWVAVTGSGSNVTEFTKSGVFTAPDGEKVNVVTSSVYGDSNKTLLKQTTTGGSSTFIDVSKTLKGGWIYDNYLGALADEAGRSDVSRALGVVNSVLGSQAGGILFRRVFESSKGMKKGGKK